VRDKRSLLWGVVAGVLLSGATVLTTSSSSPSVTSPHNVIIIMTDDQNVDSLPVMRKLLAFPQGSWVRFNNAFVNESVCCPARVTVLTGQYSLHTGVFNNTDGNSFDDTNTLPVWLDKAGYRTGLIGKYLNNYPWDRGAAYVPPGWDYFKTDKIGNVDGYTNEAVNFINTSASPFFLYLAYKAPHYPAKPLTRYANADVYVPPDPPNFNEADVSDKPRWVRKLPPLSQSTIDTWRNERVASQRVLLGIDDGIQKVIDALKSKGQLNNTMIIFMSDHGFSWGSHRWIKKECVYEECGKIPFVVRYPGLVINREENRLISNVDIAATIADYTGVTPGLRQDGRSFLPVLDNTAAGWQEEVFISDHGTSSTSDRTFDGIRVPRWTYAEYAVGDKELYDLVADPYQLQNRANLPGYQAKQNELAQRMRALRGF